MTRATLILSMAVLVGGNAFAAPLVSETFEGPVTLGDFNGSAGSGTGFSGTWTADTAGEEIVAQSLSYTFSEGGVVSGGSQALQINGFNDNEILQRSFASGISDDSIWVSFLFKRSGGTGSALGLEDFAMWWLEDSTPSPSYGGSTPNIGFYDSTPSSGNQIVARNDSGSTTGWTVGGGSSNTTDTLFVVGRLSKENTGAVGDYDGWDLWVFDTGDATRSVFDLQTPDSSGVRSTGKGTLSTLGLRTTLLEGDDILLFDEFKIGLSAGSVVPVALAIEVGAGSIAGSHTLTFSELGSDPKYVVGGSDAIFTDHGITNATGSGGTSGDVANQTVHDGHGLFVDGTQLLILQENEGSTSFGTTDQLVFDFARKHSYFGVSFQDDVAGTFTFTFFNEGIEQTSISKTMGASVSNTPFVVQTVFEFDRVEVSGGATGDGWGIDNLIVDAVHEVGIGEFVDPHVIDFESFATGPTGSNSFSLPGLTITATGGSTSGDFSSVATDDGNGLYYNGSEFVVLPANAGSGTQFGGGQVYTLSFLLAVNKLGLVFADQGTGDFTFTFLLDGELQSTYVKSLPNTNNQTFYFATDFLFDTVVIDATEADGFGLDNITYEFVPEPTSLALLALGGVVLARRRNGSGTRS